MSVFISVYGTDTAKFFLNISARMSCSTCISDILKDINYVLSFR